MAAQKKEGPTGSSVNFEDVLKNRKEYNPQG